MNLFRKGFIYFIATVFYLNISGCATYRVHPSFKEKQKDIHSFAVMTPDVAVYRVNFKGDKTMMHDLLPKVSGCTIDEIEKVFEKKNYDCKRLNLDENTLSEDAQLKTAFFNVNQRFSKALEDIQKGKKKEFTYCLGSDVNFFANLANCDVLIFAKEEAYKKTGGEIAKDVIKAVLIMAATLGTVFYMAYPSMTVIQVAVVDANTGDILWYHYNLGSQDLDCANEKALRAAIRDTFSPFPKRFVEKGK